MALARTLAPRKPFYGWYIVAVAFITIFMTTSLDIWVLTLFLKPMTEDLGWSRADFSNSLALGTTFMALLTPLIGPIVDRRGGRGLLVAGAFITGLALMALSQVHSLWQFYFLHGIFMRLGMVSIGGIVVNVAVANWFVRKRGRALGLAASGIGAGGTIMPPITAFFISSLGWRWSWAILGLLVWLLILPSAYLFMKRRPEDVGLSPDGEANPSGIATETVKQEVTWTRRQALGQATTWLIVLSFGIPAIGRHAMNLHFSPYFTDLGYSPQIAATLISIGSLTNVLARPFWGYLTELMDVRRVSVAVFLVSTLGILLIIYVHQLWALYLALGVWGVGMSGYVPAQEVLWANYYGRKALGSIRSVTFPFQQFFMVSGLLFAGYFYEALGGYYLVFLVFGLSYLVSAFLIGWARPPRHPSSVEPSEKAVGRIPQ